MPPPSGNFVTVHIQYNSLLSIFNALSGNWMDYMSNHHNSGCSGTDLINWGHSRSYDLFILQDYPFEVTSRLFKRPSSHLNVFPSISPATSA